MRYEISFIKKRETLVKDSENQKNKYKEEETCLARKVNPKHLLFL